MSDDSTSPGSLLRAAGFALPGDVDTSASKKTVSVTPSAAGSLLENAGFTLPGNEQTTTTTTATKPQGRGMWQATKDYVSAIPGALLHTVETPGAVMAANPYPPGSEEAQYFEDSRQRAITEGGPALASMTYAGAGPRLTGGAVAAKLGPQTQAINKLVEAIGPENVPAAVERMKANPRLAPADVSDPVRTMAQGLVDPGQPKAQNAIVDAVEKRIASAPDAVNSAYTRAMGPNPDVGKMVEALKERARSAGRQAIQPALENAKLVDTSPVIAAIDEKLQPGVNPLLNPKSTLPLSAEQQELARFKQQLVSGSGEQLFDAQRLHRIQSDMGDRAYQLSQSADPKDRMLGSQLRDMNEKLVDQIDEAAGPVPVAPGNVRIGVQGGKKYVDVPEGRAGLEKLNDPDFIAQNARPVDEGAYRAARAKFKDAKDISAAFESGFDTLKNRSGLAGALEDSPEAFAKWMNEATPEEVIARKLGTRADINQKINAVKNPALAGESITRIPYNRDKLKMLFGDDEANRLIRSMEDAREEALTNNKILANSKTAETLAGQKALAVPKVTGGNPLTYVGPVAAEMVGQSAGLPGVGLAASLAARGAYMGAQKLGQINALARNTEFAKAALATGPERNIIINRLLAHPKVRKAAGQ